MKCRNCGKDKWNHHARTGGCPEGRKTRVGYIAFSNDRFFEGGDGSRKGNEMTGDIKVLASNLNGIWTRYRDEKAAAMARAEETIRAEMAAVKTSLGLAGLKATFYDDHDGADALLEAKEKADDDWDIWDEIGYKGKDKGDQLRTLEGQLKDMAAHLEWNGTEISV